MGQIHFHMKRTLHVQYIVIVLRIKVNNIFSICKCCAIATLYLPLPYFRSSLSNYVLQVELLRYQNEVKEELF
jgi:hypothetical protein